MVWTLCKCSVTICQLSDGVVCGTGLNALLDDVFTTNALQSVLHVTHLYVAASLRYPQMKHHHCLQPAHQQPNTARYTSCCVL